MATYCSVGIDGKYLGEVSLSEQSDPAKAKAENLFFALDALEELLPMYNPTTFIQELGINQPMSPFRRVVRLVEAICSAMNKGKLDPDAEEELLRAYASSSKTEQ